jgi:hypothetical protein
MELFNSEWRNNCPISSLHNQCSSLPRQTLGIPIFDAFEGIVASPARNNPKGYRGSLCRHLLSSRRQYLDLANFQLMQNPPPASIAKDYNQLFH